MYNPLSFFSPGNLSVLLFSIIVFSLLKWIIPLLVVLGVISVVFLFFLNFFAFFYPVKRRPFRVYCNCNCVVVCVFWRHLSLSGMSFSTSVPPSFAVEIWLLARRRLCWSWVVGDYYAVAKRVDSKTMMEIGLHLLSVIVAVGSVKGNAENLWSELWRSIKV